MLRVFRKPQLLRRFLSVLVALAFSASALETIIPDVHDGDAERSSVETGAVSLSAARGSLNTDSAVDGRAHAIAGPDLGSGQLPSREDTQSAPTHTAHIEHCGHAHVATPAVATILSAPADEHGESPCTFVPTLVSVAVVPTLRPPIA
ncbi:MAG: hypothetical protein ABIT20_11395 [Gemmatimonadaceae bacterium]